MTRRKQNCPKRMKWEGGEEGEEEDGGPPDSPGSKDDDCSSSAMSPGSEASRGDVHDDDGPCLSPEPPTTPSPLMMNGQDSEPISMLHDPLALRDGPGSRCPSRESRGSSIPRCPSRESMCSDREGRAMQVPLPAMSPMSVNLPATLNPLAASALLPPHSAAIAAYLAAGQHPHHRLLMTSPLPSGMPRGSVSPLVSSSSSPPMLPLVSGTVMSPPPVPHLRSPVDPDAAVLDFSTKRGHVGKVLRDDDVDSAMNLSKPPTPTEMNVNSPLDLSCSGRKRTLEDTSALSLSLSSLSPSPHPPSRKNSRMSSDYKTAVSPWTSPVVASHFPYFAAAVAAASSLSPKTNANSSSHGEQLWNGKMKMHDKQGSHFGGMPTPSDATKALEKMSELSKLGGDDLFRPSMNSGGNNNSGVSGTGRHSAWQSHWLNKGAENAKDVLKCVWCKQSFPSLAAMTIHMKDAKHCGVNVPTPIQPPPPPPQQSPSSNPSASNNNPPSSNHLGSHKPNAAELNLLIKETMPLPRKLVRGQDVWLGKGAEQTRQILKCMWCGQSFRSLAEMTNHMQQTQHYTNIISQEQIISWKSSDDGKPGGGPGGGPAAGGGGGTSSHVSAVLTCKVCDQAFSSLKELSNHMVKNSHYKEHIMRSITESGGRRRQTREKRKKSLPVRKLLELERAQHELKNGEGGMLMGGKIMREHAATGRITCEKCGDKIETSIFVEHIRQCVGGGAISNNQRNLLKNALLSSNVLPLEHALPDRESRKSIDNPTPPPRHHRSPSLAATDLTSPASGKESGGTPSGDNSAPSVLNAIEKLIEKSFDSRARHGGGGYVGVPPGNTPMGSSILKRLGIDESVDYTKPLVDAQTMNILRNYHHHHQNQQHHYNRRERSGSESSSISDRGGRLESLTPDRKSDPSERLITSTPRTTPEKRIQTPPSSKNSIHDDSVSDHVIKKEFLTDDDRDEVTKSSPRELTVKKELEDGEGDDDDRASYHSGSGGRQRRDAVALTPASSHDVTGEDEGEELNNTASSRRSSSSVGIPSPGVSPRGTPPGVDLSGAAASPCRNSTSSPASSDRSGTPRSTNGVDKKAAGGSSLGALSSMFDNLSGSGAGGGSGEAGAAGSRKASSHPLAALQKLCDKTERHGSRAGNGQGPGSSAGNHNTPTTTSSQGISGTAPGAILAFSWACNDAVMTADSIMKCAFCDTPFISKGAYRHHLSKMHFVKDGAIPDPLSHKSHLQSTGGGNASASSSAGKSSASNNNNNNNNNGTTNNGSGASGSSGKSPQQQTNFEESPHSKFLKYTELAKQLSSKYV